jgi:hypothetical protein
MLSAVCLCADTRIMSCYSDDLYGRKNKMFSRNLNANIRFCGLGF